MRKTFSLLILMLISSAACLADVAKIPTFPGAPDPETHPWLKQQLKKQRFDCPAENSPVKGPADAPVTITEFLDYQCPYCTDEEEDLKKILQDYPKEVKLVIKNLPLRNIHDGAMSRAKVAQAMADQGKFWQAHDKFLHGANSDQVMKDADKDKLKAYWAKGGNGQVQADITLAKQLGLVTTPSFVIDGIRQGGVIKAPQLKVLIDYELARKAAKAQKDASNESK